jgi:hypothetical protein
MVGGGRIPDRGGLLQFCDQIVETLPALFI